MLILHVQVCCAVLVARCLIGTRAWRLEARPPYACASPGGSSTVTCYNASLATASLSHNSRWYKKASNGELQPISTEAQARIRSDGSQLRISSVIQEDDGLYCCRGSTQERCDESAIVNLTVVVLPIIASGSNKTVNLGNNVTLECIIENVGRPSFTVFRWQKSGHRLQSDGTKYTSLLIGNRGFLTITNVTTDDEGYYQCILETPKLQREQAAVHLFVDHTTVNHTGVSVAPLLGTSDVLEIHGQDEVPIGMNISIHCSVITFGETSNAQLCLVTPTGEVIEDRELNIVATPAQSGNYSCISFSGAGVTVASLPVVVYAAPQPPFHSQVLSVVYGSNISLPCVIELANPAPLYEWEVLSGGDALSVVNQTLADGSLLLTNVQTSGVYRCTAHNDYGISIQIIELNIRKAVVRSQSTEFVGKNLKVACDYVEHTADLSRLLHAYIMRICNHCDDITVNINMTSCNNIRAVYMVQLISERANEILQLLKEVMEELVDGLNMGIVVLYLWEQECSLESSTPYQYTTDSPKFLQLTTYIVLSAVVVVLLLLTIICIIYMRPRIRKYNVAKNQSTTEKQHTTGHHHYDVLSHHNDNNSVSQRSNFDDHSQSYPQEYYRQNYGRSPNFANRPITADTIAAVDMCNSNGMASRSVSLTPNYPGDRHGHVKIVPSTTHPSYVHVEV